jgi:hypothetical protein
MVTAATASALTAAPQRTTIALDRDVHERAIAFAHARGVSFREGINELVRLGLLSQQQSAPQPPFQIRPRRMGLRSGLSYDNIADLLEIGEGADHS